MIRPKAVVFRAAFKEDRWGPDMTSMYILDGHHKLLAYQNLKIAPELVIITKEISVHQQPFQEQEYLYFEYEHLLTHNLKQQIIYCMPKMILGHTDHASQYNHHLDIALSKATNIGPSMWNLFKEALLSGEKDKIDWANRRLDSLGKRSFEQSPIWIAVKIIFTDKQPQGIYEWLRIGSQAEFDNWVESLSATDY